MVDWRGRQHKELTRKMATEFTLRRHPLFLPASQALCLREAEKSGMVKKSVSIPILVERDQKKFAVLQKTLSKCGWDERFLYGKELHNVSLPCVLDYAWIDLNGTIGGKLGEWISTEFSAHLSPNAVVCLTHQYCWRGNEWLKNIHGIVNNDSYLRDCYINFRNTWRIYEDKHLAFPAFLMSCLLRDWSVSVWHPYRYFDTIDMVFYRFEIAPSKRQIYPDLCSVVGANCDY